MLGNAAKRKIAIKKFAPVVYLHPRDKYRPGSVEDFLDNARLLFRYRNKILKIKKAPEPIANQTKLMNIKFEDQHTSYHYISDFFLELIDTPKRSKKAARMGNLTTAPCYAHVRRAPDSTQKWDIQYIFFYPFNGNLGVKEGNFGWHEGDFEHITVRVDNHAQKIEKIYYGAHYFEGVWQYKQGTENKDGYDLEVIPGSTDKTHPVVYSSWHSHASYTAPGNKKRTKDDIASGADIANVLGKDKFIPDDDAGKDGDPFIKWNCADDLIELPELDHPNCPAWLKFSGRWGKSSDFGKAPHGPAFQSWWHNDDQTNIPLKHAIQFHERNNSSSKIVFETTDETRQILKNGDSRHFSNDQIRSITLRNVHAGRTLKLYGDKMGNKKKGWAEIEILKQVDMYYVKSFEEDYNDGVVKVAYHADKKGKVDGKVSRCVIDKISS